MITSTHYVVSKRTFYIGLALTLMLVAGVTAVLAQNFVQPDRRINQVAHFGGDALYCVDRNMQATNQYSDSGEGGFRLLSMTGQELWFVPSDVIAAAVAEAKATGSSVLVATGNGTYGPTRIDTYTTGDGDDYFVFIGYDEYGKPNSVEWKFCIPTGPRLPTTGSGPSLCTFEEVAELWGPAEYDDEAYDAYASCAQQLCGGTIDDLQEADECLCSDPMYEDACGGEPPLDLCQGPQCDL